MCCERRAVPTGLIAGCCCSANSLDTDSIAGTKLCKQLLKAAVVKLPQAGGDASVQTQLGDGDSEVITSPASGGSSVMPPSAEGSPSTPPALGGHVHARPDEVGGPNDVRPEGVGGPNDVQPEGVGGSDEVCPGVGAMSTTTPPTGPTSTTMPPTGPTSTLTPSTGLTSTVSQPSLAAHVRNVAALENLSPVVVNAKVLNLTFGRADLQPDPDIEMDTLLAHSVQTKARGTIHREPHRQFSFEMEDGLRYSSRHGRYKCTKRMCSTMTDAPNNCCYHPQWLLPNDFKPCGERCKAAFCSCLNKYSN